MKKGTLALLLVIFCMSFVFAMDYPIYVKTSPGNYVKILMWTSGGGPLYGVKHGAVDSNGLFNTTFFSVSESKAKIQVLVMENGERGDIIQDVKFDNQDLSKALMIDCTSLCKISVYSNPEETEVVEVNQTANETENETEQTLENQTEVSTTAQENSFSIVSVGKSIFTKADGSLNIPIIILLGVFAVIIIVLIILRRPRRKRNKKNKEKEDPEERELEELERKVKEKEEEIKKIKDERERKKRIEETRNKLYEEEKEIKNLTGREDEDYIKLKKIEDARKKLAEDERTLSQLKGSNQNPKSEERKNIRDNPAVRGFLDNMKKYSEDKK